MPTQMSGIIRSLVSQSMVFSYGQQQFGEWNGAFLLVAGSFSHSFKGV